MLVTLLLLLTDDACAGAWTRSLGSWYTKLGADYYLASEYVIPGGGEAATQSFVGHQYSAYAEAGLAKGWPVQLSGSVPLTVGAVRFERSDVFQTVSGDVLSVRPGDLRLRPQIALHRKLPLALAVDVKVPLYAVDRICADQGPYRDLCPRPGDGQVDVTEWLLAGATLSAVPVWGEVGVGWQHRTEAFVGWDTDLELADGLTWAATVGGTLGPALIMAKADGIHPVRDDDVTPAMARVGPSALVTLGDGVGIEARAQWDVYARAASKGVGFGAGVSWRR